MNALGGPAPRARSTSGARMRVAAPVATLLSCSLLSVSCENIHRSMCLFAYTDAATRRMQRHNRNASAFASGCTAKGAHACRAPMNKHRIENTNRKNAQS